MKPYPKLIEDLLRGEVDASTATSSRPGLGRELCLLIIGLGAFYGACMGLFGYLRGTAYELQHILSVMVKVPILFLATLVVTAPSMYVFAALARSQLRFRQTLLLLLSTTAVCTIVLGSFGPVTAFFTCSTKSYPFIQLLNVFFFGVAGIIGLVFLLRQVQAAVSGEKKQAGTAVVRVWIVIYAAVGAQMGWLLRPFIGFPGREQQFLRETSGNILTGILDALKGL